MKVLIIIKLTLLVVFHSIAQTNAHLPLKSYAFDFVSINTKDSVGLPFHETARFNGVGEIYIYSDSITISWSNEWESGTYRLFIDTAAYELYDSEWLSFYSVRSKGYHDVNGTLILIEGSGVETGRYTDIVFDTNLTKEKWAKKRRVYVDVKSIE